MTTACGYVHQVRIGASGASRFVGPQQECGDVRDPRALADAPGSALLAGIGFALSRTSILPRMFARTAVLISGLFLIAGLAAVFATAGLILAIVMSVVEAVWIAAAAIAFARTTARTRP